MRIKEIHTVAEEYTSDILCNRCGRSTKTSCGFECATVRESWGYCSHKDLVSRTSHLCEDCLDEIMKDWKIPPEEEDSIGA